jgi:predicted nucleic acid-binding protein
MIALDTSILVQAHRTDAPRHAQATSLLRTLSSGRTAWSIPWSVVYEFIAEVTDPARHKPATPIRAAHDQVTDWMESPSLQFLGDTPETLDAFSRVAPPAKATGDQVVTARIVATCLAHGVRELWTADRDYSKYPELITRNPLQE